MSVRSLQEIEERYVSDVNVSVNALGSCCVLRATRMCARHRRTVRMPDRIPVPFLLSRCCLPSFNLIPPLGSRSDFAVGIIQSIHRLKGGLELAVSVTRTHPRVSSSVRCTRRRFATSTADRILWPESLRSLSLSLSLRLYRTPVLCDTRREGNTGVSGTVESFGVITRTLYFALWVFFFSYEI